MVLGPTSSVAGAIAMTACSRREHAFYLDYKNVKADYLKAIWNVINFDDVSQRLADAQKK